MKTASAIAVAIAASITMWWSAIGVAPDAITIASFNIQVFGRSKMEKPEVVEALAKIVRRFDVVAIQEIRCRDDELLPDFLSVVNRDGAKYSAVIGPRLGRTSSKEQYAFVFNTKRIEVVSGSIETVADPEDRLHREPFVVTFRVRGPPNGFTFTLVNIHTDPDETKTELNALADVFRAVQSRDDEDDVILLGDFNEPPAKYGKLGMLNGIMSVINGKATNTRGAKSYDNLVYDGTMTGEFTGRGGVLDMKTEYGLSLESALKVSDHMPVWGEFSSAEHVAPIPEVE